MQKYPDSAERDVAGRSRGRPRAFDRTAALDKAMRLFWSKGYEATSIADLTEAMEIGPPSLYAAFGSKEALYTEALEHYCETNADLVWGRSMAAASARDAVRFFLEDSAMVLTGAVVDIPRGCMVTLSSVGGDDHAGLSETMRDFRAVTFKRVAERLARAVGEGEIPDGTDIAALARFVQTVQGGMSILARDGVSTHDLLEVAKLAMLAWDSRVG